MKLHFAGEFNGDENTLPQREHHQNAVPFKEPENMRKSAIITNMGSILTMIILAIPFILIGKKYFAGNGFWIWLGLSGSFFTLFLHELLHAICFKNDVYFYTYLSKGIAFVIGTENMSKARFIVICLCPNIILGLIPYVLFFVFPNIVFLGAFGLSCIGAGFGDYLNIYNAIKQMPKGAKTYLNGMHSYWYI